MSGAKRQGPVCGYYGENQFMGDSPKENMMSNHKRFMIYDLPMDNPNRKWVATVYAERMENHDDENVFPITSATAKKGGGAHFCNGDKIVGSVPDMRCVYESGNAGDPRSAKPGEEPGNFAALVRQCEGTA